MTNAVCVAVAPVWVPKLLPANEMMAPPLAGLFTAAKLVILAAS
jgi:hypothetical protein